jgi:peptidoglycan/LPS O-acetylase OafA/YrhL
VISMAIYELTGTSPYYPLHLFVGFFLFVAGRQLLRGDSLVPATAVERVLRWSYLYSYKVYLVHQFGIPIDYSLALTLPEGPSLVILVAVAWSLGVLFLVQQRASFVYRAIDVVRV